VNIIVQLTKLLDSLFLPYLNNEKKGQLQLTSDLIHAIFLQALIWSFGAGLKQEDRIVLDTFIKYLTGLSVVSVGSKAKSGQLPNEKPLLFDHIFQSELDRWIKWDDLIPKYQHDRSKRFTELLVPTVDTVRIGKISRQSIL
jgi:dynein heavy chain